MSTLTPRILSLGVAGLGLAAALAGCASDSSGFDTSAEYTDGSYTAEGSYVAPSGTESVTVELTLKDDVVTDVTVTGHSTDSQAARHQGEFSDGIAAEVVGKDIDTLEVTRVGGSSLTSGGFNKAVEEIKADALVS